MWLKYSILLLYVIQSLESNKKKNFIVFISVSIKPLLGIINNRENIHIKT